MCNLVILNKPPQDSDGYFRKNNVLMHRKFLKDSHDGLPYVDRVVVPEAYRSEILRMGHAIPLAGHMGKEKKWLRISARFFWPRAYQEVRNYCETCPECQLVARKLVGNRAALNSVPIISEPFKKIVIDIIGKLPRTKSLCFNGS